MKRKDFIKKGIGFLSAAPVTLACVKNTVNAGENLEANGSTNGSSSENCEVTNSETAGPFPIKNPSNFVYQDITLDRQGVPLEVQLSIKDASNGCEALEGARVDIWHCDSDGNYSQYGGHSNANFLRGRQITDSNGMVVFKTIFPGWYPGRAVHIHVQVFNNSGNSELITQIAFPAEVCDAVFQNATDFYSNGLADTSNERDGIFRDGFENEMASITGSVNEGFVLTHNIEV
ncbi:intradiol ring-cleavage dioxygenase [Jiulongibacter sediminis]|uniref:Intradiol ring-cleavage dioxygenase n=1 Tax=Jiulongibacter sediminis TaxID=1605367 RepID=A0A0P7C1U1_9BACT|nr:intradiol ring-cleavage dioxygenase [Jiulongibacter sediminis]KPM47993.1 intradiol ring-cleavage dioxygenase [Jiulongibacter sediminis]TBX24176.1 intradiol ring-cleavage dioxygenase [Jiulongibacter sediminis]